MSKIPGNFCFKCRNKFVLGGGQETLCIWGGSDKEHGPKLFRLNLLLKVNNSNNCTIADNYSDNYQDSIILRHQYHWIIPNSLDKMQRFIERNFR